MSPSESPFTPALHSLCLYIPGNGAWLHAIYIHLTLFSSLFKNIEEHDTPLLCLALHICPQPSKNKWTKAGSTTVCVCVCVCVHETIAMHQRVTRWTLCSFLYTALVLMVDKTCQLLGARGVRIYSVQFINSFVLKNEFGRGRDKIRNASAFPKSSGKL